MAVPNSYVLFGGDVILWAEDGVIKLKTCDPNGDAVELNTEDASTLSRLLLQLAAEQPREQK